MSVWVWCYDGVEIRFVDWQLRQVRKARPANVGLKLHPTISATLRFYGA